MSRLLSAGFVRLRKSFIFYLGLVFMVGYAVVAIYSQYNLTKKFTDFSISVDEVFLLGTMLLPIAAAVFVSIFIGTEYNDGTIRNKLIVGHSRIAIYLSNLIISATAVLMMHIAYMLAAICIGLPLLGVQTGRIGQLGLFTLCSFVTVTAFVAIFLLASMLIQSKAVGAIVAVISAFALLFAAMEIASKLSAPEYYDTYAYMMDDGTVQEVEPEKNPHYLRGTERKVYEFLWDFLPYCQVAQLQNGEVQYQEGEVNHLPLLPLYSLFIIIVTTLIGIVFFNRKDLK